ncbi:MAG TPA: TetR/AcrR family transcriptional regulator [Solirubrobacterales bacterium]|nr:TetR/AcrR family transcriptional regulator [Solirubrobacterales bacterium]
MASLPEHLTAAPMGRERLSRETLTEHQRARLLDAAIGVFAKRGYQETTIDNLVAAAKSSVGGFYALFENKEDCFLALYDRTVAEVREKIEVATSGSSDWAERALLGLRVLLVVFDAEPLKARIALVEVQTAGTEARARHQATIDSAVKWLGAGRGLYPAAAELPPTFEQAAVGGVAWFLQQRLESSAHESVEELFADTTQLLLEPIFGARKLSALRRSALSAVG